MPKKAKPKRKYSKPTLKPRQAKFVKEYTDPKSPNFSNGRRAAIAAGYSPNSATEAASENLTKTNILQAMSAELDAAGATLGKSAAVLAEAMDAETVKLQALGKKVHVERLPDHANRIRAVELAGRFRGAFPTNQVIERRELLNIQQNILVVPPQTAPEKPAVEAEAIIRVLDD